jgi:DNA helicase-2/ATP-dependent DNA helicase PcrA
VVSTEFDFVEPNKKKQITSKKVLIQDEDISQVKEQIKFAWDRIQARDFYTGCGKPDCHWCNFVKTNKLAIAEIETDDEE